MPVDKKQHTTLPPNPTTAESSSSQEVVQQAFHQHLRDQIRGAVQVVMEDIMREELTQSSSSPMGRVSPRTERIPQWEL
jgi:hypothetical protein